MKYELWMAEEPAADTNPIADEFIEADFIEVTVGDSLIFCDKNRKILHAIAAGVWRTVSQKI